MAEKPSAIRFAWIRGQLGLENPKEIDARETAVVTATGIALAAITGFIFLSLLPARNNDGARLFLILTGSGCVAASSLFFWGCAALAIKAAATKKAAPPPTGPPTK